MNSFRLLLCVVGLFAYIIAKQFTAPDGEFAGLPAAPHLLGMNMNLPKPGQIPAEMKWMNAPSNAEPQLLPASVPAAPKADEWTVVNAATRTRIGKAVRDTVPGASLRLEQN